jgi:hypothetical protein
MLSLLLFIVFLSLTFSGPKLWLYDAIWNHLVQRFKVGFVQNQQYLVRKLELDWYGIGTG